MAEYTSLAEKFTALRPVLNEPVRRRWAATEALAFGRGGITGVEDRSETLPGGISRPGTLG